MPLGFHLQPDCAPSVLHLILAVSLAGHCLLHWLLAVHIASTSCACLWLGIACVIGCLPRVSRLLLTRVFCWALCLSLAACCGYHCRLCCQCIIVVLVVVAFRGHLSCRPCTIITVDVFTLAKVPLVDQAESSDAVVKFSFLVWRQQSLYLTFQECVRPLVAALVCQPHASRRCKSTQHVCRMSSQECHHWKSHCEAIPCHHLVDAAPQACTYISSEQDCPCCARHQQAHHA